MERTKHNSKKETCEIDLKNGTQKWNQKMKLEKQTLKNETRKMKLEKQNWKNGTR